MEPSVGEPSVREITPGEERLVESKQQEAMTNPRKPGYLAM
jgi:hypothetical protein